MSASNQNPESTKANTALAAWPWVWAHLSEGYKGALCALAGVPWLASRCKWDQITDDHRAALVAHMRSAMNGGACA